MFVRAAVAHTRTCACHTHSVQRYYTTTATRHRRMRQHLNPLAGMLATLKPTPEDLAWSTVFKDSRATEYHLDLGSGSGKYLAQVAKNRPDTNWIGVELKEGLVKDANEQFGPEVPNFSMVWANLLHPQTLDLLFKSLPDGEPSSVSILHPDPNFKVRHKKRDVITARLLDTLAYHLDPGTYVYTQTDVLAMDEDIHALFQRHACFDRMKEVDLDQPLLGVPTDRERYVLEDGEAVYRRCYRRTFDLV